MHSRGLCPLRACLRGPEHSYYSFLPGKKHTPSSPLQAANHLAACGQPPLLVPDQVRRAAARVAVEPGAHAYGCSLETHRAARCRAQHGGTGPSTGTRGVACLCTQEIGPRALPRLGPVRGSKGTCGAHHSVVRFVICCIAAMGSSVIAWALEAAESAHSAGPKGRASASY